jgi:hypothetical protein
VGFQRVAVLKRKSFSFSAVIRKHGLSKKKPEDSNKKDK